MRDETPTAVRVRERGRLAAYDAWRRLPEPRPRPYDAGILRMIDAASDAGANVMLDKYAARFVELADKVDVEAEADGET